MYWKGFIYQQLYDEYRLSYQALTGEVSPGHQSLCQTWCLQHLSRWTAWGCVFGSSAWGRAALVTEEGQGGWWTCQGRPRSGLSRWTVLIHPSSCLLCLTGFSGWLGHHPPAAPACASRCPCPSSGRPGWWISLQFVVVVVGVVVAVVVVVLVVDLPHQYPSWTKI